MSSFFYETIPNMVRNLEPAGGIQAVYELDLLVLVMTILSCVHATYNKQVLCRALFTMAVS